MTDDTFTIRPSAARHHPGRGGADHVGRDREVQVDVAAPGAGLALEEVRGLHLLADLRHAGVVNEGIQRTELLLHLPRKPLGLLGIHEVGHQPDRFDSRGCQLLHPLVDAVRRGCDGHGGSTRPHDPGGREADPLGAAAAGHEGNAAVQRCLIVRAHGKAEQSPR